MTGGRGESKSATTVATLKGVRILLVEDSWHVAHALEAILDTIGMKVQGPAATIAEAEALLAKDTPDVAIVDMNLHGEMAYGLVARLHDLDVPVIIVSGYEVHPSMHNTATTILTKPIRAEALLTHLRRVVAEREATSQPG